MPTSTASPSLVYIAAFIGEMLCPEQQSFDSGPGVVAYERRFRRGVTDAMPARGARQTGRLATFKRCASAFAKSRRTEPNSCALKNLDLYPAFAVRTSA
jgi:hypothetical protein